jgi:ribosomal protein S10
MMAEEEKNSAWKLVATTLASIVITLISSWFTFGRNSANKSEVNKNHIHTHKRLIELEQKIDKLNADSEKHSLQIREIKLELKRTSK